MHNPSRVSEQEYLALERAAEIKHELVNGLVVAMAGFAAGDFLEVTFFAVTFLAITFLAVAFFAVAFFTVITQRPRNQSSGSTAAPFDRRISKCRCGGMSGSDVPTVPMD